MALFGSHARGDAALNSDVDLLLVTDERRVRHAAMGDVSLFLYPWSRLLRAARGGDLFVRHIVQEARALHDPGRLLENLRAEFRLKRSYSREISNASDLGWFIVRHPLELPQPLLGKRIAWCVRTILIARSAEQGSPVFSASALAEFSGSPEVTQLISAKTSGSFTRDNVESFRSFLETFGHREAIPGEGVDQHLARFRELGNRVALHTLSRAKETHYES